MSSPVHSYVFPHRYPLPSQALSAFLYSLLHILSSLCPFSLRPSLFLQHDKLSVNSPAAAVVQTPREEYNEGGDEDDGDDNGVRGGHVVGHIGGVGLDYGW